MKNIWKKSAMTLALAVGVVAGVAMGAGTASQEQAFEPAPQSQTTCPTAGMCDMADRSCIDPETTPGPCATLTRCYNCGWPY